jgi:hypothetical protein
MNEALQLYENEEKVASIHGYSYPVKRTLPPTFFLKGADCWGWGTWKRAWSQVDWDAPGLLRQMQQRRLQREFNFNNSIAYTRMLKNQIGGKIDSWAITWYAYTFLAGMYTLYPYPSLVKNIGHDNSGTHTGYSGRWGKTVADHPIPLESIPVEECPEARKAFEEFFRSFRSPAGLAVRLWNKLLSLRSVSRHTHST